MTLHGVTKDVKFAGKISVKGGKVIITSSQMLLLQDYKIAVPNAVKDKVSKDVKITVITTLELMK
jgi:polyisoprenoid-binding protein YceI